MAAPPPPPRSLTWRPRRHGADGSPARLRQSAAGERYKERAGAGSPAVGAPPPPPRENGGWRGPGGAAIASGAPAADPWVQRGGAPWARGPGGACEGASARSTRAGEGSGARYRRLRAGECEGMGLAAAPLGLRGGSPGRLKRGQRPSRGHKAGDRALEDMARWSNPPVIRVRQWARPVCTGSTPVCYWEWCWPDAGPHTSNFSPSTSCRRVFPQVPIWPHRDEHLCRIPDSSQAPGERT